MREFLESRAGKQFLILAILALVLWVPCIIFHEQVVAGFGFVQEPYGSIALTTITIGGLISFIYSVLRISDLRKEMVQRSEAEKHADWIATHDQLTKLPNRYAFERVNIETFFGETDVNGVEISQPSVTVFSVDLDGFKQVNDLVGHHGGDLLLCEVARRLCHFASTSNVFRFGGDEFIILARNLREDKEETFAKLLIQLITRPIMIGEMASEVGASVGYSRWPEEGSTLEAVSHKSDIALYEAKATGPNKAFRYRQEMQQKVAQRARLEEKLRRAIDNEEIQPHYQPLIDLKSGKVCGFEALARWTDGDKQVPPNIFIPLVEKTGLITNLFQTLLSRACQDAREWPPELTLAFNVSPVQMDDRLLAARILDVLGASGLPAERLEVEITENALIHDPELAAGLIDDLHKAGIQIALDDFGTGYSSLSQLARHKFDKIKIDKSFVATFGNDERQKKIVEAMLGLSKSLNLKTTIEGIEHHTQLAYFLKEGCDIGQGYLFGKAMPANEVATFLREREQIAAFG